MEKIHILLYYKFVELKDIKTFVKKHLVKCKKIGLLGKVLVAKEGINGSVSGTKEQVEKYKEFVLAIPEMKDIVFKEETAMQHPFTRMVVREKNEIIRLDKKIDLNKRGKYLSPKEFLELYNEKKDVIILDARNNYESEAGKFKNAVTPDIETFREFPKVAEMLKDKKDKKIVMYCTGGIRCEKASAYLAEKGFTDVSQLEGGIITFCQQFPNTVWEGKCFVFDKRLISSVDSKNKPITKCVFCNKLCDLLRNCKNNECDKLIIMCLDCEKEKKGCCSGDCLEVYNNYIKNKAIVNQNRKSN